MVVHGSVNTTNVSTSCGGELVMAVYTHDCATI